MSTTHLWHELYRIQDLYLDGLITRTEMDGRIKPLVKILNNRQARQ